MKSLEHGKTRRCGDAETRRKDCALTKRLFLVRCVAASPTRLVSHLRVSASPRLRVLTLMFIVALFCLTAHAQMVPREGSPLYNSRPYTAQTEPGLPKVLKQVGFEQRLNEQVPLDLKFRDETGREVKLGDYFGTRPVVLALVYYDCPMLCTQVLNGMVQSFKGMSFKMGEQYNVVTVSFDPRERPELAASKKRVYLMDFKRPGVEENWHFLTGDADQIKKLADAVGFHYVFDEQTKQFAHASGIMVLTPQGKLARYFYGIEYAPKDVRLGIVEASEGKIGTPVDQLLLYCYHYDPATGKYGAAIINIIRLGGVLTVLGMVALLFLLRRRGTHAGAAQGGLKAGGAA